MIYHLDKDGIQSIGTLSIFIYLKIHVFMGSLRYISNQLNILKYIFYFKFN